MKQHSYTSNSKAKTRRVYLSRFAVFALLFVIMLIVAQVAVVLLERICDDRSSTQKISKYQIEDFYALEENSLDILFMGSSHAMCTYNPYAWQDEFSATAYNLGTALQQPDTAYHLLREVYKTQRPKVLVYDVYFKVMQCEKTTEQAETVLMELKPSLNKCAFWWNNLDMDARVNYFNNRVNPFGRLFSILSKWESARKAIDEPRNSNYRGNGFYVTDSVVSQELLKEEKHPFSKEYVPFTDRQTEYLKKMVELAQSYGTKVVFVSAPIPPTILNRIDYYPQLNRDAKDLADELGVEYFDFATEQLSGKLELADADFADQGHLNFKGAEKFNKYIMEESKQLKKLVESEI